jgi:hypothetical protein
MSDAHSPEGPKPTCIITVVHGTWGRGFFPKEYRAQRRWLGLCPIAPPPWFHEDSCFRNRLESELRNENIAATFRAFEWSGANSVFHRARAADELSSLLASDRDNANSIVIAHSHGGNVAFRAISKLGSRGATIHLITLATPFLRVFPTWSGPRFSDVIFYFGFAMLAGPNLWLLAWLAALDPQWELPLWADIVRWILPLVAAPLLVLLIVNPPPPSAKTRLDRQHTKTWAWRPFIIAEAANYDSAGPGAPNLLVIRGIDDEAALMLAFGSIATAINRFLLRATQNRVVLAVVICLFVLGWALMRYLISSASGLWMDPDRIWNLYMSASTALLAAPFILLLVPGFFKSWFGKEFLFGAMRCEIATDSTPDSLRARIVTLETPYQPLMLGATNTLKISRMRHKIYDYPDCVPEIVKWIRGTLDSCPRVPAGD